MTTVKLPYVDGFKDRHGRWRFYFRKGKGARVALPGRPGTPPFMVAYQKALENIPLTKEERPRGQPGTFDRLVQDYFASADFLCLTDTTRIAYRRVIERFIREENIGHRLVSQMTRQHVQTMVAKRAATPGAANDLLKKIKILVHFAIDNGWRKDDPTFRIKKFAEGEFHTWTDEEIATFERHWPVGTRERTAFALLLYTGQRASDVKAMSWQDVKNAAIRVMQGKTGAKLRIPLHPELARILEAWPKTNLVMLTTQTVHVEGLQQLHGSADCACGIARAVCHAWSQKSSRTPPRRSWMFGERDCRRHRACNPGGSSAVHEGR